MFRERREIKPEEMGRRILITGGAGFIGSHLADGLLEKGYDVRVLDNIAEQVHGRAGARPDYLDSEIELQVGDVRDRDAVRTALERVDRVEKASAELSARGLTV